MPHLFPSEVLLVLGLNHIMVYQIILHTKPSVIHRFVQTAVFLLWENSLIQVAESLALNLLHEETLFLFLMGPNDLILVLAMTSYLIYTSGMTREKCFNACTQHLGEFPIYALYGVLCESAQLLFLQTRQLILQMSRPQVHAFLVYHGNTIN